MHGKGSLLAPNGCGYIGDFVRGVFHGKGKVKDFNGDWYEGEFANGRYHGYGKGRINGVSREGQWRNGEFVGR
jgi:hypothetical protein